MTATFPRTFPPEVDAAALAAVAAHAATQVPVHGIADGALWVPEDHDYLAWAGDVAQIASTLTPLAGYVHLTRIPVRRAITVGQVALIVTTVGAGLSNSYAVLYDDAGNRLGMSAEQGTAWQTLGHYKVPLTAPVDLDPGHVYAGFLIGAGSPLPLILSWQVSGTFAQNANLPPERFRTMRVGPGHTAPPATLNLTTGIGITSRTMWAALA